MPQDKTSTEREMASLGMYTCIALSRSRRGRGDGNLSHEFMPLRDVWRHICRSPVA